MAAAQNLAIVPHTSIYILLLYRLQWYGQECGIKEFAIVCKWRLLKIPQPTTTWSINTALISAVNRLASHDQPFVITDQLLNGWAWLHNTHHFQLLPPDILLMGIQFLSLSVCVCVCVCGKRSGNSLQCNPLTFPLTCNEWQYGGVALRTCTCGLRQGRSWGCNTPGQTITSWKLPIMDFCDL